MAKSDATASIACALQGCNLTPPYYFSPIQVLAIEQGAEMMEGPDDVGPGVLQAEGKIGVRGTPQRPTVSALLLRCHLLDPMCWFFGLPR